MTWMTRLRLLLGLTLVVVIVGALTLALSHRKGETTAGSAEVAAVNYSVGSDYAGAVLEQFVERGDLVRAGDPIATIQSNDLVRDLADEIDVTSNEVFQVNLDGTLTVKSAVTGVVISVDVQKGGYASAGGSVATIAAVDTLFVDAEFELTPQDFARIMDDAPVIVTLPDGSQLDGTAGTVDATTVDGRAIASVEVVIDPDQLAELGGFISPGTPVTATMTLRNDDVLASFSSFVRSLVTDVRESLAL